MYCSTVSPGINVNQSRRSFHKFVKTKSGQVFPKAQFIQGKTETVPFSNLSKQLCAYMASDQHFPPQTLFEYIFHHENDVKNVSLAYICTTKKIALHYV